MAGSYSHVTTNKGKLRNPKQVAEMIDTPSDVYQTVEHMYGMLWWLANNMRDADLRMNPEDWIRLADKRYSQGIEQSPGRQKPDKELR